MASLAVLSLNEGDHVESTTIIVEFNVEILTVTFRIGSKLLPPQTCKDKGEGEVIPLQARCGPEGG